MGAVMRRMQGDGLAVGGSRFAVLLESDVENDERMVRPVDLTAQESASAIDLSDTVSFFFSRREGKVSQRGQSSRNSRKPVVPHHLRLRRDVVAAPWRLPTKQRLGESLRRTASQHRAPSSQPCCGHTAPEEFRG